VPGNPRHFLCSRRISMLSAERGAARRCTASFIVDRLYHAVHLLCAISLYRRSLCRSPLSTWPPARRCLALLTPLYSFSTYRLLSPISLSPITAPFIVSSPASAPFLGCPNIVHSIPPPLLYSASKMRRNIRSIGFPSRLVNLVVVSLESSGIFASLLRLCFRTRVFLCFPNTVVCGLGFLLSVYPLPSLPLIFSLDRVFSSPIH